MEFRLLGPLEVRADGGPLPLGGAKQRALLALLLLNANRVVARERLVDGLWGERPPETAVQSVHSYVSRLRKLLPPETLVTRGPGYQLRVGQDELDLERFESLRADGRPDEALALWQGPPLVEFDEPFARLEAARLEELRLVTLEERIEADLAAGRQTEVVGELEALIAEHPNREGFRARLMLALYRSGRQADALAAYRDTRAALHELGIEPSQRLRTLERAILTQDATLDLATRRLLADETVPLPGPLVPESPFPFVGRESELAKLRSLLGRAERGEGALVLVTGEPGAGKTRLLRELAHEAAAQGALVLYGASDAAVSTPYQPLREWLEFLLRICEPDALQLSLGREGRRLARLVPDLEAPRVATEEADAYQLQGAATKLLSRLSRTQPLLLAMDDLHWADAETLQLLRRLARMAPEARVLIVAAYRDPGEEITPQLRDTLADLSRLDAVSRLTLRGLTADEVGEFIEASADATASAELTAAIGELTDGTPLLVCELWRDLQETGAVDVSSTVVRLARPVAELRGSERIRDIVQQRLARLSPEANRMIELAAVTGPRFELPVVAAAARLDRAELTQAVVQASRHGLVEELPQPVPTCRFTHELVRRAVYDPIERIRVPELHLNIGEALEQIHAPDLARVMPELAHHFTLAAPLAGAERAVEYNVRAAEAAVASAAYFEAAARLSTALALGVDDPRERVRLKVELGKALWHTGRAAESEALFATARDTATDLADQGLAARALVEHARTRIFADPGVGSAEALLVAEHAIETFEALGDTLGLAEAEALCADALLREGRRAEGEAVRERALAHAQAAGAAGLRRRIVRRLGLQLCAGPTPVGEALGRLVELASSSRDDRVLEAGLGCCQSYLLAMAGRFDEARARMRVSIPVLDEAHASGNFEDGGLRGETIADAHILAGEYADAERETIPIVEQFRHARGDAPDSRALQFAARLALIYCDQGRWQEAADSLAYGEEVDRSPPAYGKVYVFFRLAARARVAAHRGELPEALELGRAAVEAVEPQDRPNHHARISLALAEVQSTAGNTAEADTAVLKALALYEQKGNIAAAARVRHKYRIATST